MDIQLNFDPKAVMHLVLGVIFVTGMILKFKSGSKKNGR